MLENTSVQGKNHEKSFLLEVEKNHELEFLFYLWHIPQVSNI